MLSFFVHHDNVITITAFVLPSPIMNSDCTVLYELFSWPYNNRAGASRKPITSRGREHCLATTIGMAELRQKSSKAPKPQEEQPKSTSPVKNASSGTSFYWAVVAGLFGCALTFSGLIPLGRSPAPRGASTFTGNVKIETDIEKRDAIVAAFRHAYSAYERDAFGADEYHPISQKGSNLTEAGGIGYTIADSIDTIIIMQQQGYDFDAEYERAKIWIRDTLSFDRDANFNTFETTIRVFGGLLSAHYLTSDDIYLDRAREIADRIMPVFETPVGLPTSMVNLCVSQKDGKCISKGVLDKDNGKLVSVAEAATLQLEFKYLSHLTEEDSYWRAVEKVMAVIKQSATQSIVPIFLSAETGQFVVSDIRLGSRGDSYYEYLLKQYLQTDRSEGVYRVMYDDAMAAIGEHLLMRTPTSKIVHTGELQPARAGGYQQHDWKLVPKQDHLVCFLGGSLLLGVTDGGRMRVPPDTSKFNEREGRDWTMGVKLIEGCMATHETATGLAPEIAHFRTKHDPPMVREQAPFDWYIKGTNDPENDTSYDARYILRPETVESLFLAYRLTGDPKYRRWGWRIFQSIEEHCKVPTGGYATVWGSATQLECGVADPHTVLNVDKLPVRWEDKQETFLLSETLKYLFLLFSDSTVLPLDEVVFNTEAHPFPVFTPSLRTAFA
ncbi:mannosyl-oligosaccharide alpha-1,2-mannosidase [Rhizoctonia solani]|uniref:alpha-1,2-Mannosidase n=1 Tax=Rhizoctonia solani TaxID=456999 RepID=A0A0K6G5R2_9AGAM|nr:mannosyl-oligosaccharide alpha-1,2-mannosidase [Rhizoctonia solani]